VNAISLRHALTPDSLQGRVNATFTFVAHGMSPLGALLGGVLGGLIGLPMTLVVGELGMLLAVGWLLVSPLRTADDRAAESETAVQPASA